MPRTEDNEEVIGTVPFNSFNFNVAAPHGTQNPRTVPFLLRSMIAA